MRARCRPLAWRFTGCPKGLVSKSSIAWFLADPQLILTESCPATTQERDHNCQDTVLTLSPLPRKTKLPFPSPRTPPSKERAGSVAREMTARSPVPRFSFQLALLGAAFEKPPFKDELDQETLALLARGTCEEEEAAAFDSGQQLRRHGFPRR